MRDWPPIHDPAVLEWMSLDHDAWLVALQERFRSFGARTFDEAAYQFALGYPWERPAGSYVFRDGEVTVVEAMPPGERRAVVAAYASDRHPLVTFGANGAPDRLQLRFHEFSEVADREALVLTGELHDVDVGAQASPTAFGNFPGALIASPGTAVRASVLWLTPTQLAEITRWELGYRLGRLDKAWFTADETDVEVEDLFAYVSRIGTLCLDGSPVVLGAIPGRDRTVRAMTQEELLDAVAALALGAEARARDVARMCVEDTAAMLEKIAPLTWPTAVRLPDDHWTPYPAGRFMGGSPA